MPDTAASMNGTSSLHDLLALSDEQILEIDPEAQDVEISSGHPDASDFDDLTASAHTTDRSASRHDQVSHRELANAQPASATSEAGTEHEPRTADHASSSAFPPQWLADRMSDPQVGAEARELWNSSQLARQSEQARQEAAAFREVFAKPDDARAAAQRARLLDDIDHAYFAGDATQRASLAASMLREDPAAFREMVFAGLRALEEAGHGTAPQASVAHALRLDTVSGQQSTSSQHGPAASSQDLAAHAATSASSATSPSSSTGAQPAAPQRANADHVAANEAHVAAYTAFERGANEDLERAVGSTIDRTLEQALPHAAGRADSAAMKTRLAATIRQDVEKALQGDRQLGEQVAQILSARRFDSEARASVVRLIGERAQQLVPGSAKRILSEWTQTTLSAHRSQRDRTDAASARREAAPANTSTTTQSVVAPRAAATAASLQRSQDSQRRPSAGSARNNPRGVDYRLSDEQILDL